MIILTKTHACIIEMSRAFIDGHMLDFLQNLFKADCLTVNTCRPMISSHINRSSTPIDTLGYWWQLKHYSRPILATFAQDLLSVPASQAYMESSVCGLLTSDARTVTRNAYVAETK